MSMVTVYGASDDLIEVEGHLSEEFNPSDHNGETSMLLAFGDGTVLLVSYTDTGIWRIRRTYTGTAVYAMDEDPGDLVDRYSDRVTLSGDLRWVMAAEHPTLHLIP